MDLRLQVVDNKVKSTYYEILTELFETGTSEGSVEVDTLTERVDFGGCSQAVRKRRIARGFEPLRRDLNKSQYWFESRQKKSHTFLVFALEFLSKVQFKLVQVRLSLDLLGRYGYVREEASVSSTST